MKHTKGKWKFERHGDDSQYFGNVIAELDKKNGIQEIRTITCHLKYGNPEENEANAQLITSAPELLEACKGLHKELKELWLFLAKNGAYPKTIDIETKLLSKAKQAIAKAEGEK